VSSSGADGVETMVGRWADSIHACRPGDMESCASTCYRGSNAIRRDLPAVQRSDRARRLRLDLPKGVGVANVGLGLVALKTDGATRANTSTRGWNDASGVRRAPAIRSVSHQCTRR